MDVDVKQENSRWIINLEFEERFLRYNIFDKRTKIELSRQIEYEKISNNYASLLEPLNVGVTAANFILFFVNFAIFLRNAKEYYGIFILGGLLVMVALMVRFTVRRFIVMSAADNEIKIIENQNGRAIKENIISTRNEYLNKKYGSINWENNTKQETEKFLWLADIGAISKEELGNKIKELNSK
jgi:hypothetical protein